MIKNNKNYVWEQDMYYVALNNTTELFIWYKFIVNFVPTFLLFYVIYFIPKKSGKITKIKNDKNKLMVGDIDINKIMEDGAKKKFKEMSEDNARRKTHFSFGKYINARWYIQEGSRLTLWFQNNKIYNTDDMIDCIIAAYHRSLNNQPIQFEQLAEYYFKKQKEKVDKLVKKKAEQSKARQK